MLDGIALWIDNAGSISFIAFQYVYWRCILGSVSKENE